MAVGAAARGTAARAIAARRRRAGRDMIPAERQALVLELVRRHGATSIQKLAQAIGASLSTIRRDLDYLTGRGYLERTHGGAMLKARLRTTFEPSHEIASKVALVAKTAIGAAAAALVEEGQSVILDSSSTVLEAARVLAARDLAITVLTNDLGIARLLAPARRIRLIVLGGQVRPESFTLTGEPGQSFVQGLHTDLALIGIHSLARLRLSDSSIEVAAIKRALIGAARRVVVLADSSKFEHPAFCEVCPVAAVQTVITDAEIAPHHRAALEESGVELRIVALGGAAPAGRDGAPEQEG